MSNFRKALMFTAIPIVVLSLISLAGIGRYVFGEGVQSVWFASAALWVIAIGAAIVFSVKGKRGIAAGILAGIGIGFVAIGGICLADLFAAY